MQTLKEKYNKEVMPKMTEKFGYKTPMAVPKILKVVVNSGIGKLREKKDVVEALERHLTLIVGQKLSPRPARLAVASYKTRKGMIIGYKATLRGNRMYDFLERLISLAIPRTRDFRGITVKSVDQNGNLTIGIKEHIVFPEMIGEDVRTIFGFEVTVVTNSKTRNEALELFKLLGFPLQKNV